MSSESLTVTDLSSHGFAAMEVVRSELCFMSTQVIKHMFDCGCLKAIPVYAYFVQYIKLQFEMFCEITNSRHLLFQVSDRQNEFLPWFLSVVVSKSNVAKLGMSER